MKTAEGIQQGHAPEMTSAAVPAVSVVTTNAPGRTGPHGTQPRTNYSRVNTGTPSTDFGADQRHIEPKQAEFHMHSASRPTLSQLTKQAALGVSTRASLLSAAAAQATGTKVASAPPQASNDLSTEYLDKLASMLVATAEGKLAANPGEGPGALTVTATTANTTIPEDMGAARTQIPKPTLSTGPDSGSPANQVSNDVHDPPGGTGTQQTALPGPSKIASFMRAAQNKLAQAPALPTSAAGWIRLAKRAADAAPNSPTVSATGENTPAMPANAAQVASPEAIARLTRTQAHAQERQDMRAYVDEPALTSATDKTLKNALDNNTGSKIASGESRVLAAQAYLNEIRQRIGGAR